MGRVNRQRVRELLVLGQVDAAVAYLRESGLSKIGSIKLLNECGLDRTEAKSLIHDSPAWADVGQRDDEFHRRLEDALEGAQADPADQADPPIIHVRLLNEGADAWRPTQGRRVSSTTFVVQPTPDYDEADEEWEFEPGRVVVCRWERRSGGPVYRAVELAELPTELRDAPMCVLGLAMRQQSGYAPWVETGIDGTPFEAFVGAAPEFGGRNVGDDYLGSQSHDLLPPHGGLLGGRGSVLLLVCAGCREPGCAPVTTCVEVFDRVVTWSQFEASGSRLSIGPIVFDRRQYEAQVAELLAAAG
ncbi:MAG: hypothetical protein KDB73_05000 [Planctomycetes bacterium]|nr:hypothetical protein [Planctomycetota bacterium]